jgi:glycosyltransferase involved in cell wall biosynthesis
MKDNIRISVIIPAFNEEESTPLLYDHLKKILMEISGNNHEIIFIDDGSRDNTPRVLEEIFKKDPTVSVITLRKNFGKAQALAAGFASADGDYILTLDADLQDDPDEIPRFIEKLEEGYDLVVGWKALRRDPILKVISSRFFNWVNAVTFGLRMHDINCGFKAFRREVIEETELYGELHRYIPIIAHAKGFKCAEIKVKHHPRKHGKTKYGWKRYFQGFFDLLTSMVITKFAKKPLHFFGSIGFVTFLVGFIICVKLTLDWFHQKWIGDRPLLILGVLFLIVGMQIIMIGLVSEIIINREEKKEVKLPVRRILSHSQKESDDDK